GRDRPDYEEPAELRVDVVRRDLAVAEAAPEAAQDPDPVTPEEDEQDDRRGEVRRDEEGEEVGVVLVDVPAQDARQDDAVAEARDREELGHALEQAEDHGLPVGDQRRERDPLSSARGPSAACRSGTRRTRDTRARRGTTRFRASRGGVRSPPGGRGSTTGASRRARPSR